MSTKQDIVDVEGQLDDVEAGSGRATGGDDVAETTQQDTEMTPIERLSRMDTEDTGIDVTPSIERAVSILGHWREWSNKTPKGRVLKDGLENLLRTATGEKLAWRQVYRAAEALEELSKGRIEFIHHNRQGRCSSSPRRLGAATVSRRQRPRGEPRQRTAYQTIARKQE